MRKTTVDGMFLWSLVAVIVGAALLLATATVGYSNGAFVMHGPDVQGIQPTPSGYAAGGLAVAGFAFLIGGAIGQLTAWIGALAATASGGYMGWFAAILVFGIVGLWFLPMLLYVVAGPRETSYRGGWHPSGA